MEMEKESMKDKEQTWTAEEIKQLIYFAQEQREVNEDLRAGIILMQAKLDNEEAKVRQLTNLIKQLMNQ